MEGVKVFSSSNELAIAVAEKIVQCINESGNIGRKAAIALSGGETPKILFSVLQEKYAKAADWSKADFFWVDERCVPPDDPESNYGAAYNLFFSRIDIPGASVHRIIGEADPAKEAVRYAEELRRFVPLYDDVPSFDIIFLGIGNDGHIASIFPGRNDLFETEELCSVARHPEKNQKRITITGRILNNARKVIFVVSGKGKAEIVKRIFSRSGEEIYPASLVNPEHGKLVWMLDSDAASMFRNESPPSC
jgi:6-phosphogluconolactonase